MMSFYLFIAVKTMICVTLLVYGNLIAECVALSRVFSKNLYEYHQESFFYILGTLALVLAVLFFDLTIDIPNNLDFFHALRMIFVQGGLIFIGFLSLRQSTKKAFFITKLKNKLANLSIREKQTIQDEKVPVRVYAGRIN